MRHARNTLAGLLLLSVFATSVPSASAAGYDVEVCTPRATKGEGVFPNTSGSAPPTYAPCGSAPEGAIRLAAGASSPGGMPLSGTVQWSLEAPLQTSIVTLFTERFFNSLGDSGLVWEVLTPSGLHLDRTVAEGQAPPAGGIIEYPVHSTKFTARLSCPTPKCQGTLGTGTDIAVKNVIAHMDDGARPGVPVLEGFLGVVSGSAEIPFTASDKGSGIATLVLVVDGEDIATFPLENGGKCVKPYTQLVPCTPTLRDSLPLNTTSLADGRHQVQIAAIDAAGQRTVSLPKGFTVENSPPVGGSPEPGSLPPDTTAPVLSAVSLAPKRFAVARGATALAATARATKGTSLRFTSSEPASLAIAIAQVRHGKPARQIATLTRSIGLGAGRLAFSGRAGAKPLRPGTYAMTLTARDSAGNESSPVRVPFTVVAR